VCGLPLVHDVLPQKLSNSSPGLIVYLTVVFIKSYPNESLLEFHLHSNNRELDFMRKLKLTCLVHFALSCPLCK